MTVQQQSLKEAARCKPGTARTITAERCQNQLRLIEQRALYDRLMLALVDLVFVLDLADVGAVAQNTAQGAAVERCPADVPSLSMATFGRKSLSLAVAMPNMPCGSWTICRHASRRACN
jgi:hypothetical protein